jgi:hypothetical protein
LFAGLSPGVRRLIAAPSPGDRRPVAAGVRLLSSRVLRCQLVFAASFLAAIPHAFFVRGFCLRSGPVVAPLGFDVGSSSWLFLF